MENKNVAKEIIEIIIKETNIVLKIRSKNLEDYNDDKISFLAYNNQENYSNGEINFAEIIIKKIKERYGIE